MIFEDKTGQRWFKIKLLSLIVLFILFLSFLAYVLHLYKIFHVPFLNVIGANFANVVINVFIAYLLITIVLGFLRMGVIFYFCFRQNRRKKVVRDYMSINKEYIEFYRPRVTIIVPVYNEEVIIKRTVNALLKSNYPLTEILIIDDGSTDQTASIIKKFYYNSPKVKLIQKENGGKASALNLGFQLAKGEIVITIDADTIFHPDSISYLVENFSDPQVAAVTGNCKVGNIKNQLTLWQHIEYVTAQNLEKRAFEELDCITVVSGSNGAWRKSVVEELGFYHKDTLAEDSELTIRILNAGHKIIFEDRALSFEECPETVKDFLKQRYRWSYGVLQTAYKHRKAILSSPNKKLKYFAVPSLAFSYLLFLTSPIIDVLFIIALLSGTTSIYYFTLLFYFTDSLNSLIAFIVGKEKKMPLIWLFFQRLAYRYFLGYITWKAVISALRGHRVGWGKLKRSGNNQYK